MEFFSSSEGNVTRLNKKKNPSDTAYTRSLSIESSMVPTKWCQKTPKFADEHKIRERFIESKHFSNVYLVTDNRKPPKSPKGHIWTHLRTFNIEIIEAWTWQ